MQHLGSCGTQYQRISLDFESSPAMQVMVYERHNSFLVISDTDQCSERQIADAAESEAATLLLLWHVMWSPSHDHHHYNERAVVNTLGCVSTLSFLCWTPPPRGDS